jgi:type IX secretion system PorP/SprF family membrane protein
MYINYQKTALLLGLTALFGSPVLAQQMPVFNQHIYNNFLYNPARTGVEEEGNIWLGQRKQWTNMPDAPDTYYLSVESPIRKHNIGIGGMIMSDRTHILQRTSGNISFGYHNIKFADGIQASVGLAAGFYNQSVKYKDVTVSDPNDNILYSSDRNTTAFHAAAGLLVRWGGFRLDIAAPQLLNTSVDYLDPSKAGSSFQLVNHSFLKAGYQFGFGEPEKRFNMEPSAAVRLVGNGAVPIQGDFNLLCNYGEKFWLGGGMRIGRGVERDNIAYMLTTGVRIAKRFSFHYTYEGADAMLNNSLGASHEFTIGYKFGQDKHSLDKMEAQLTDLSQTVSQNDKDVRDLIQKNKMRDDSINKRLHSRIDSTNTRIESVKRIQERLRQTEDDIRDIKTNIKYHERKLNFEKIGSVYFVTDQSELMEEGRVKLRDVKEILENKPKIVKIYIQGHASREASQTHNLMLSDRRIVAVKQYLVGLGISEALIITSPFGEESPINTVQETGEERARERRVDIIILEDKFK